MRLVTRQRIEGGKTQESYERNEPHQAKCAEQITAVVSRGGNPTGMRQ
jgi:hypothetical protein